jgi:hypothetical protein
MSVKFPLTRGEIGFPVEAQLDGLDQLRSFLMAQTTQPPISAETLANARTASIEEVRNPDRLPEDLPFTEADINYLLKILDWVGQDENSKAPYVTMEEDDECPDSTFVTISFPLHLEPPAELR